MASSSLELYHGPRDQSFKEVIVSVLRKGNVKQKYIDMLTDDEGMRLYSQLFTHSSYDPVKNYEFYEHLGDSTANKCLVWYFSRRFPQIFCPEGVKISARLKINYGSKESFAPIAESLGFWPFISASVKARSEDKKPLLEDTFEAFIGGTEYLIDLRFRPGVGYSIVYDVIASVFDQKEISLNFEELKDAKTRVKEIFDFFKKPRDDKLPIGDLKYENVREDRFFVSHAFRIESNGRRSILGTGRAPLQAAAEQKAAEKAEIALKSMGYFKPVSSDFSRFCKF